MPDAQLLLLKLHSNCRMPEGLLLSERRMSASGVLGLFKQLVNIEYPLTFLRLCFLCLSAFLRRSRHSHSASCLFASDGGWRAASVNEAEVDGSGDGELHLPSVIILDIRKHV